MNTTTDSSPFELGVACSLTAGERVERGQGWEDLLADAEEVRELAEGYALKFPNRDAWITQAVELIVSERKCCPFFRFSLAFEPEGGPVWLHIEGQGEVKSFIKEGMLPRQLRPTE
jgi:hypothetical protein